MYSEFLRKAIDWVSDLFHHQVSEHYVYHTLEHSLEVMKNVELIGRAEGMVPNLIELGMIAGIFHDSGYSSGHENHEESSVRLATGFLQLYCKPEQINCINDAILATKYPQKPGDSLSKVLCDADLYYLGSTDFTERARLLWKEWILTGQSHLSEDEFFAQSLEFMQNHHYHTRYGKEVLEIRKQQNIEWIKKNWIIA